MNDILQRMISRTQVPLSPVQPILPSVFAHVPSIPQIESEIVVSNPSRGPGHAMPSQPETQHDRQVGAPSGQETGTRRTLRGERELGESLRESRFDDAHAAKNLLPPNWPEPETAPANFDSGATVYPHVTLAPANPKPPPSLQLPMPGARHQDFAIQPQNLSTLDAARPPASPVIGSRNEQAIFFDVSQPAALRPAKTEVFISIGHIEVRSAPRVEPAPAPRQRYRVTLQDYLTRREEDAP
jgi:hypothetical protein